MDILMRFIYRELTKAGAFNLISIAILILFLHTGSGLCKLAVYGKLASGTITDMKMVKQSRSSKYSPEFTYAFTAEDGKTYTAATSSTGTEFTKYEVGQGIPIVYDPQDPSNNVLDYNLSGSFLCGIILCCVSGFWILLFIKGGFNDYKKFLEELSGGKR